MIGNSNLFEDACHPYKTEESERAIKQMSSLTGVTVAEVGPIYKLDTVHLKYRTIDFCNRNSDNIVKIGVSVGLCIGLLYLVKWMGDNSEN